MEKKIKKILFLLLAITFSSSAFALPATVRFNSQSPIYQYRQTIADIYIKSCAEGIDGSFYHRTFPMYSEDKLTEKNKKEQPNSLPFKNQIGLIVAAGFDMGLTISRTDLNFDEQEQLCYVYGINYTASAVNFAGPQTGGSQSSPPPSSQEVTSSLKPNGKAEAIKKNVIPDNPLYDLIITAKNANTPHPKVTPRLAQTNGCRYMYHVLSKHPVIEVNALDATLDIMLNMYWDGYSEESVKFGYNYFLQGAKFGRFLFATQQPQTMCYD